MQKSYVTNNHLKNVIKILSDYINKGEEPTEELFLEFIGEMRVSNLLIPGYIDGDDLVFENVVGEEINMRALNLFTDDEEFIKDRGTDSGYEPIPNDIDFYLELMNENSLDGVLINCSTECFFMPAPILNSLPLDMFEIHDDFEGYDATELKDIAQTVTNREFVEFMQTRSGKYDFEELLLRLSESTLLNVVFSDDDFSKNAQNGMVSIDDVESWGICTAEVDGDTYGLLYTSKSEINTDHFKDSKLSFAYQVTVLSEYIDYVLRDDMEGIIVNPDSDDFYITRENLLQYSSGLDNPSLKNGIDYAFLL